MREIPMAIDATFYGTVEEADEYFANRLHEFAWTAASPDDRRKALIAARRLIDGLNFKGSKHSVATLDAAATPAAAQDAETAQPLEFPRGDDTVVPEEIRRAEYEIAHSLLDNKDPELELETLAVTSTSYSGVRTSYERGMLPIEHLINLIPNALAWRLLRPFLRDEDAIKLSRVS
jgi:hypothetical protein